MVTLVLGVLLSMTLLSMPASGSSDSSLHKERNATKEYKERREKARYYYLEGLRHQVENHHAEAYEYFRHAMRLDPTYSVARSSAGALRLRIDVDTLQTQTELLNSMEMLRPFVDEYPKEYDENVYYAFVASRLDAPEESRRIYERLDSLMPERTETLLRLADIYFTLNEHEKGLATLDRYERIEGKSPQITLQKIGYMLNRKDTVGAMRETTALIESNPREADYLVLKGNIFHLTGQKDSVLIYFKKAEALAPNSGSVKMYLADYYLEQGDSVTYDNKIYEALLAEDFGLEEKAGLLANYLQKLLADKSDTSRGDYLFMTLEKQYPHEKTLLDLAARYSAAKGDFATAIEKAGYALDMDSSDENLWMMKMNYHTAEDDYTGALATYDEACKHLEPSSTMRLAAAYIAQMAEQYDRATAEYEDLIRKLIPRADFGEVITMDKVPSSISLGQLERAASLYTTMGDCYHQKGDIPATYRSYDSALVLNPEYSMALNNYAYFLTSDNENPTMEDLERAENMSRRSLKGEDEKNPTYLDTLGWILYKMGKYEEAEIYQREAIDKSEEQEMEIAELYDHYSDILRALGKKDEALEALKKALEIEPDNEDLKKKSVEEGKRR